MPPRNLTEYLADTARRVPESQAVVDPGGWSVTYRELNERSDRLARFLVSRGVQRGDRVGVILPKSIHAVVSLFAAMKAGAAYVPVDVTGPIDRGRRILTDCHVRAAIVDERSLAMLPDSIDAPLAAIVTIGDARDAVPAGPVTALDAAASDVPLPAEQAGPDDLAYILYTSGSTGVPKGVMLTHENAISFVEWCSSVFTPGADDRFSSHAPFHFDLSILDLYLPIKHGATLFLISETLSKSPKDLAAFIAANRLTVWYSTPSILTLLAQFGNLERLDIRSLRLVLFAGEVFPVKHLRAIQRLWPGATYYNLYGPTETNVCTFAQIPREIPESRDTPFGIGIACSHCLPLVLDETGQEVAAGNEGLLYISGPSVFGGYWNRPAENERAFIHRDGARWYNTGDVVAWNDEDGYLYVGRRDRMVKRRGYRIELGEIERALYLHPEVREAAVVSVPDADSGVKIVAFLSCRGATAPSVIDLKTFCAATVPAYMNPDRFIVYPRLPRTSTDKVDYQTLRQDAQS